MAGIRIPRTELPSERPLKVYAFDPTKGRYLGNFMTINVRYERNLKPGPVGDYLAVIDYDGTNKKYYPPVNLNDQAILARGGLDPTESDPRFHQQMVYAVASETIRRFEFALGRKIKWRPDYGPRKAPHHGKLRIFPHAMQEANAFYDPKMRALLFGYFPAAESDAGANLPGQVVFTCLSHDIVAHETTHAIIDGLRRHFNDPTSPDTPAFHEAFADIVALFQHFSFKEALLDTIQRTGGFIHRSQLVPDARPAGEGPLLEAELTASNPIVELAKQFGEAMGNRAALRAALGTPPNSQALESVFEPHARGGILVAAVFDAFFSIYLKRTRDLMRIARAGGALTGPGDLHPDLAERLARAAAKTAQHFQNICIRALDYCPAIDIQFGDFLRALITADADLVPDDQMGYRGAFIDAFRSRGIRPEDVTSYSEEALRWCGPEQVTGRAPTFDWCWDEVRKSESADGEDGRRQKNTAIALQKIAGQYRRELGLSPDPQKKIQAHSFRRIFRVGPDGQLKFELVVEFMQIRKDPVPVDPKHPELGEFTMRGGSTAIINQTGEVRYAIWKSVDSKTRLERQREYYRRLANGSALAPFVPFDPAAAAGFRAIHRGY